MADGAACFEVQKPGAITSVQDLGRHGLQHLGVPVSGVVDELAHRLANALVGNRPEDATLEVTLLGPTLRFVQGAWVACCGAELSLSIDGRPTPNDVAAWVPPGGVLQFGRRVHGLRAVLAVAGGIQVDAVMGSRSTYARGGFGGFQGRPLRKGDAVPILPPALASAAPAALEPAWIAAAQAVWHDDAPLRVTPGREWDEFLPASQQAWLADAWRISPQSDRMGYRLDALHPLQRHAPRDMLSESVTFGTVQVPPDGQPIVLMAERQTSGGYARIAQVASADLPRLAQAAPGDALRFAMISTDAAQALDAERQRLYDALASCARSPA